MTAVRHTQDRYLSFMANDFPITFSNWTLQSDNFSTVEGIAMLLVDIVLYNAIGFFIDYFFYAPEKSKSVL